VPPCENGSGGGYIRGKWKLLVGNQTSGTAHNGPAYPNASTPAHGGGADLDCGAGCLFDIRSDPTEEENVAGSNPQVVVELQAALAAHAKTYYQTPMHELDCDDPRLKAVLASGRWQPFAD
jgi:hypothetical protein